MDSDRYLLDTHSLIWLLENSSRISKEIKDIVQDRNNEILFSQISLFEVAIKQKVGKSLNLSISVDQLAKQAIEDGFDFLPIQNEHIYNYNQIPLLENHRDPFDRLLIATAHHESAVIITADEKFNQYKDLVKVLW